MTSPLESLPNEIFDLIITFLIGHDVTSLRPSSVPDCTPLARLSRCSRLLNSRVDHVLFGTIEARNSALRHGCVRGNLPAIRKAVLRGAHSVTVRRHRRTNNSVRAEPQAGHREASALQLALKARQFDAFELLLNLGLSIAPRDFRDTTILGEQVKTFARKLAEPRNVHFLEAFVNARRNTPYWHKDTKEKCSQAEAVLSRMPFADVVRWASPTLLEKLLDNGAQVNEAVVSRNVVEGQRLPITALGAACLRGDMDVFKLLVARGAQIGISNSLRRQYPKTHSHIPIFMAARHMGETGRTDVLDACVKGGEDIDRPCHIRRAPLPDEYLPPGFLHVCTTPLLTYLDAISSWEARPASTSPGLPGLTPTEGVAHFIKTLGAAMPSPVAPPFKYSLCIWRQDLHDRTYAGVPSAVEFLLVKWGTEALAQPRFFTTIKLLVENDGTGPDLGKLMVRLDGQNNSSTTDFINKEGLWDKFLAVLTPRVSAMDQTTKNILLRRVIVDKGALRHTVYSPSRWVKVRAIGQASIRALVAAGADINDQESVKRLGNHVAGYTPLNRVVSDFVHTDSLVGEYLHDHPRDHRSACPYTADVVEAFGGYLAFLVSLGADPKSEEERWLYDDESSAVEMLIAQIRKSRSRHVGGLVEQSLLKIAAKMQGLEEIPEYTGERDPFSERLGNMIGFSMSYFSRVSCQVEEDV
ncbi:uncharacterized protein B0I36DRAFT_312911 [Microdochium trichocladiopsis]|uniref:Ankyrin repeat-containing domain protein n=1 Tax=Microdochium trichocladiopsis TaxID=1682393 RepID=A0A9P8YKB9_9PEZI|nr:uncharacterized protein B0I36DRAFT_312911 [Microdochium trichocladiopsis]KAH7041478.1 hypothetical protein B0I36DRAFT_312911 [Microdochium trichocladiopsis]